MARKSVTEYAGGKGPRQHIWEAIRRLAATGESAFTEDQIWQTVPRESRNSIDIGTIRDYRRGLVAAGVLAVVSEARHRRVQATYRLVKDEGIEAPRVRKDGSRVTQGLAQEQMWRTLRLLTADISGRELAAHASTPAVPVAEVAARDYLKTLHQAGYLLCTREGKGLGIGRGGMAARYRLKASRNTGPRPPMVCRTRVVYDPNENRVVWQPPVTDEDAIHGQ